MEDNNKILIDKNLLIYLIGYLTGLHSMQPENNTLLEIINELDNVINNIPNIDEFYVANYATE